jgi:hypothetical protein
MTLLVGSLNVVVAVPLSTTEMVEGLKVSALIVAVVQGSVTVMVKTTLSESDAGVNVVEPAGPLLAIVIVFESFTSYVPAKAFLVVYTESAPSVVVKGGVFPEMPSHDQLLVTAHPQFGT